MGILNDIFGLFLDAKNADKKEEKVKNYENVTYNNLEPWQAKLVDEGTYDETSFEEDGEQEEDDYYSEDDE